METISLEVPFLVCGSPCPAVLLVVGQIPSLCSADLWDAGMGARLNPPPLRSGLDVAVLPSAYPQPPGHSSQNPGQPRPIDLYSGLGILGQ